MKNYIMISTTIYLIYISLASCGNVEQSQQTVQKSKLTTSVKAKKATLKTNKPVKAPVLKVQTDNFSGRYSVTHQGTLMLINLIAKGNQVTGNFTMNGQQAKITGTIINQICKGNIVEVETGKTYQFESKRSGDQLSFSFTVPEQKDQVVNLMLKKTSSQTRNTGTSPVSKNPMLVGTWRYTEVISSGSGQFYSSFATDYFAKFNGDGTAYIWTGKSAGGTNVATIEGAKSGTVQRVTWYTDGKLLYFVNPENQQKTAVNIYIEPNRMMITSGNSKKVYQRIN